MVTEKRLKEVEDSVRAIAEYVKQQNTRMEKQLNTRALTQDGDELLVSKNLSEEINSRMDRLEKYVADIKNDVDEITGAASVDDVHEKMKSMDRRLDQALSMKNQIDEMETAIRGMKGLEKRLSKMEQDDPAKLRSEVAKDIDARLRAADERIVRRNAEEFKKIYEVGKQFHKEGEPIKKMLGDFEKRIKTVEALLEQKGREEIEQADSDILSDIQKILKR